MQWYFSTKTEALQSTIIFFIIIVLYFIFNFMLHSWVTNRKSLHIDLTGYYKLLSYDVFVINKLQSSIWIFFLFRCHYFNFTGAETVYKAQFIFDITCIKPRCSAWPDDIYLNNFLKKKLILKYWFINNFYIMIMQNK